MSMWHGSEMANEMIHKRCQCVGGACVSQIFRVIFNSRFTKFCCLFRLFPISNGWLEWGRGYCRNVVDQELNGTTMMVMIHAVEWNGWNVWCLAAIVETNSHYKRQKISKNSRRLQRMFYGRSDDDYTFIVVNEGVVCVPGIRYAIPYIQSTSQFPSLCIIPGSKTFRLLYFAVT